MTDMSIAEAMEQSVKRYKVAVIMVKADLYTIRAKNGQEASKLVVEGDPEQFGEKMGRPAGFEGPNVIGVIARDMDDPNIPEDLPFLEMFQAAMQRGGPPTPPPQESSNIIVPKLVAPSELV